MSLGEQRLHVCVGAGGVGKTTTAAALALALARDGRRVVVVTIDPARRLAAALGLDKLSNEPHRIDASKLSAAGEGELKGELWAMMLDSKQTFDELIGRLAPNERARDEALSNRIYREVSTAVAGSQEFTAIAKLYDLDRNGDFDAIVLDTPPSRNALDFLAAPKRLTQFFEGRALRVLLAPTRITGRGVGLIFSIIKRVTGADLLSDLSAFFQSLSGMIDGFGERAAAVEALLRSSDCGFVLVTSPEHEPLREALEFARELHQSEMTICATIVNRVHVSGAESGARLGEIGEPRLAGVVERYLADYAVLAERDAAAVATLEAQTPGLRATIVPELAGDVHDLAGLARIAAHLQLD